MPLGTPIIITPVQPERLRGDRRDLRVEIHQHHMITYPNITQCS